MDRTEAKLVDGKVSNNNNVYRFEVIQLGLSGLELE